MGGAAEVNADLLWAALPLAEARAAREDLSVPQRIEALLEAADLYARVGDTVGAEAALERALSLKPGDPDASLQLARLVRDRPESALRHARQAARSGGTARTRIDAHRLAGEIFLDLGDKAGARASLKRALAEDANDVDSLRVMTAAHRDEPERASWYADKTCEAASVAPVWRRASALRICAETRVELKNYAGAVSTLLRALDEYPDDLNILRALLRIKNQRPQEAIALTGRKPAPPAPAAAPDELETLRAARLADRFTAAIAKAPSWQQSDAYRTSAEMWLEAGDAEKALASLFRAEDFDRLSLATQLLFARAHGDPKRTEGKLVRIYSNIAEARTELGDLAGAEAGLQRGLAMFPFSFELLDRMVDVHLAGRRPAEALVYAERGVAAVERATLADIVNVRWQNDLLMKAILRSDISRDQAIALYLKDEQAAESMRRARVEYRLKAALKKAQVLLTLRDEAGAEKIFKSALAQAPGHAPALRGLFELKLAQRRADAALEYGERLLTSFGTTQTMDRVDVLTKMARVLFDLKNEAGAEARLLAAHALAPDHAPTLWLLFEHRRTATYAERLLKALEKASPAERASVHTQMAQTMLEAKDERGAELSLKAALAELPGDAASLRGLFQLALAQKRAEDAVHYGDRLLAALASAPPAERAGILVQKAQAQLLRADPPGAEASLTAALALTPGYAPALRGLFQMRLSQRRPQEARTYAERLLKVLEKAAPAERASVHGQMAQSLLEAKDERGAELSFKAALTELPGDAASLRGLFQLDAARWGDRLLAALASAPPFERADVHARIARARLEAKDESGAESSFQAALALEPQDEAALRGLLQLRLAQRRPEEARTYAQRLINVLEKSSPAERASARAQMAQIQLETKDERGAELGFKAALAEFPGDAASLRGLFQLMLAQRRAEDAERWGDLLLAALASAPPAERAGVLVQKAQAQLLRADAAGAEASLAAALALAPGYAPALKERASLLVARGDFRAALEHDPASACFDGYGLRHREAMDASYFDACISRFPENPALYVDRGVARYRAGRTDDAAADFRRALKLKPDHREASLSLAALTPPAESCAKARVDADDDYHTCLAFTAGKPGPCGGLKHFEEKGVRHPLVPGETISIVRHCEIDYYEMEFVRAWITNAPEAARVCEAWESVSPPSEKMFRPSASPEGCAALVRVEGDLEAACRALGPRLAAPAECLSTLKFLSGADDRCGQKKSRLTRERCEGFALFKKARPSGESSLCAGNPVCLLLLRRDPALCENYAARIRRLADSPCDAPAR